MRETIMNSIVETIQDLMNAGLATSFTNKELKNLGVNVPENKVTTEDIKNKRIDTSKSVCFCQIIKCE